MSPLRSVTPARFAAVAVTTAALVATGVGVTADAAPSAARGATAAAPPNRPDLSDVKVERRFPNGLRGLSSRGNSNFLLTLDTASTASVTRANRTKSRAIRKRAASRQRSRVAQVQRRVVTDLPADSSVLYRTHAVTAAVAIRTDVRNASRLGRIDGVTGVYPIAPKKRLNSYAVPHQGAQQVWQSYGDSGQNSSIAVIDGGIDYTHSDFGGPGTDGAYETAKSAAQQNSPTAFPTEKVIGGYDFVGDDYDADPDSDTYQPNPKPDANPLDCDGHGTHVAGSAAGFGVNADGSTYTGAYSAATPVDDMRVGPGMAPRAKLYAYRVLSCAGYSVVLGAALDRALDPNGDGDTSDHVDVVNMSLGADFVPPGVDADSLVIRQASAAGVVVVAAGGNAGDVYDVDGAPANEPSVVSVASTDDAQDVADALILATPAAQYPATRSAAYDFGTNSDLSGTVARPAENATGCAALSPAEAAAVNGKVAFLEWHDAAPQCGSVTRAANVRAAGATGYVLGSDAEQFTAGIGGSTTIPGVLVAKSGADAIRARLQAGSPVVVGSTAANRVKRQDPSRDETLSSFSSRGVRGKDGVKPDVAAIGGTVFSAASGTGDDGLTESGTSMASPMTAGLAALVRSQHRDWSPELVKADIMNTAGQDVFTGPDHTGTTYGPNRVGAGRIEAKAALDNTVLAYTTGSGVPAGVVSASFGPVAVTAATTTLTKTITVQNTELTPATFATSYVGRTAVPGATYTVSPSSVTVGPRAKTTVTVTLTLNRSALTKTIDPTVSRASDLDGVQRPRQYVADASGLVTLTPTAGATVPLRVPVYAAPRPAATMTGASPVNLPAGLTTSGKLNLTGSGIDQGSQATRIRSAVAGFELQGSSGLAPTCTQTLLDNCVGSEGERSADLKYVGTTSSAPQDKAAGRNPLQTGRAYFAVTTQSPWRTPVGFQEIDVFIDTDGDDAPDAVTYTARSGSANDPGDVLLAITESLVDDSEPDVQLINDAPGDTDTAVFDSDVLVLPVSIAALPGVSATNPRIRYSVNSFVGSGYRVDSVGGLDLDTGTLVAPRTMDVLRPGITVTGTTRLLADSALLYADQAGSATIRRDNGAYAADSGLGALLVHFHNAVGQKAQVVTLVGPPARASLRMTPTTVRVGAKIAVTVSVSGTSGVTPTGTVVLQRYQARKAATNVASVTLRGGRASRTISQGLRGTFYYRALFVGDRYNSRAYSATVVVRAK